MISYCFNHNSTLVQRSKRKGVLIFVALCIFVTISCLGVTIFNTRNDSSNNSHTSASIPDSDGETDSLQNLLSAEVIDGDGLQIITHSFPNQARYLYSENRIDGVAVIVELSRNCTGLVSTVQNVLSNLPSSWIVQIFHGYENHSFIKSQRAFQELHEQGRLHLSLVNWEESIDGNSLGINDGRSMYNKLLTSKRFWNEMKSENILLFQPDARLCSNSSHMIMDFYMYDYIGAPWRPEHALSIRNQGQLRVGNGGLSFRKRKAMLAVVEHRDAIRDGLIKNGTPSWQAAAEDIFFIYGIWWLNNHMSESYSFKVAEVETAAKFAMEWGSAEFTAANKGDVFGVHQIPGGSMNLKESGMLNLLEISCPDALAVARQCICDRCRLY